jgi:hypothetical protein
MRLRRAFVSVVAAACLVAGPSAAAPSGQPAHPMGADDRAAPVVAGCRVLPADNYWNTRVDDQRVHPRSDQWLRHMSPRSHLHPDFGPSYGEQPVPYGIPITVVGGGHRRVPVRFQYAGESDRVRYPLGRDTRIEGGREADGDRHAVVVDRQACRLYETFGTRRVGGRWRAGSGAVWNLSGNRLRPDG